VRSTHTARLFTGLAFIAQTVLALSTGFAADAQTTPAASVAASAAPAGGASAIGTTSRVAVIEIQSAILQTKDGQKALADMQAKFNPVKSKLDAKRAEIAKNEDSLRKGQSTLSQDAQAKLSRDIDIATKSLNRDTDDANADLEAENQKMMNDLGGKMMAIINKYAADKGLLLVLDVSSQQTPVLWASNTIDITRDVIAAYDSGAASLPAQPSPVSSNQPKTRPVSTPGSIRPASGGTSPH
jgi:outer membrane protein